MGLAVAKKRWAMVASETEKECDHQFMAWSGKMPCTGIRRCSMCGLTETEIEKEREVKNGG